MPIKTKRDTVRAAIVKETAMITGVSVRQVRRVLLAEQRNEEVMSVFMELLEGRNNLLQEVKRMVPFTDAPVRGTVLNRSKTPTL